MVRSPSMSQPPTSDRSLAADVIVVGSGAAGAWAAYVLASAGVTVLVLEAGPDTAMDAIWPDFSPNAFSQRVLRANVLRTQSGQARHPAYWVYHPDLFVNEREQPHTSVSDVPFVWIRGRQVGGRTTTWGGVTLRMSNYELRGPAEHGYGPEWPLTYEELDPHYAAAEVAMNVQGSREGLATIPDGVFAPAEPMTPAELHFQQRVRDSFPDRQVIPGRGVRLLRTADGSWPRRTSQGFALQAALATGRVRIRHDAIVDSVKLSPDTKLASGVTFIDARTQEPCEAHGRVVVLAAGTIETVRLLLNSKSSEYPTGLGNTNDHLGRYLLEHVFVPVRGYLTGVPRDSTILDYGGPSGIIIPRFRISSGSSFAGGYGFFGGIQRWDRDEIARAWGAWDADDLDAPLVLVATGEVLPRWENRITLDPQQRDRWGIPSPAIHFRLSENEHRMLSDISTTAEEMITAAGGKLYERPAMTFLGGSVHEVGGARMGRDPRSSIVNPNGQLWSTSNVLVVDGACWPTSGWQNPTLSIMAIAGRACTLLVERLKRNEV
jgi:choline dehydrogenase-like flavoprotein